LHSVCTASAGPTKAYTEMGSVQGGTYYQNDNRTISEYGPSGLESRRRNGSKRRLRNKASEGNFPYEEGGIVGK